MSHITRRKSAIKNADTLKKACDRVAGAKYIGHVKKARGAPQGGHQFKLKGWEYPVTVDATGECIFDNYGGQWGNKAELDKITQGYAVEAANTLAIADGLEFVEEALSDGSIKCTIPLGGDGGYATEGGGDGSGWDV